MRSQSTTDDGGDRTAPFPDRLFTTIRVERVDGERFRATQRDSDFAGYGTTPHRAIADYARRVEAGCLDGADPGQ